jgi:hypothetical protein
MARSIIRAKSVLAKSGEKQDDFGDKMAKYVPVESLVALITLLALFEPSEKVGLWAAAGFSLALAIILKFVWAKAEGALKDVKPWEYLLVAISFTTWAIGTTPVGAVLFSLSGDWSALLLIGGAFAVPAFDHWTTKSK